jgi:hypothetical protein
MRSRATRRAPIARRSLDHRTNINERVRETNARFELEGERHRTVEVLCKRGSANCAKRLQVTREIYERLRPDPEVFVFDPGHEEGRGVLVWSSVTLSLSARYQEIAPSLASANAATLAASANPMTAVATATKRLLLPFIALPSRSAGPKSASDGFAKDGSDVSSQPGTQCQTEPVCVLADPCHASTGSSPAARQP